MKSLQTKKDSCTQQRVRGLTGLCNRLFAGALASVLILAATPTAHASTYEGYILNLVQIGTTVFVSIGNGWYGANNCGTGTAPMWVTIDTTAAGSASYVSLALSAKLTGNQVYVSGNNVCFVGNTPNGATSEALATLYLL